MLPCSRILSVEKGKANVHCKSLYISEEEFILMVSLVINSAPLIIVYATHLLNAEDSILLRRASAIIRIPLERGIRFQSKAKRLLSSSRVMNIVNI
jgi:hypothetical protein